MQSQMVRMGENGRVVIPAPIREAMGLKPGAALHLSLDEEGLRIQTVRQQIARAQAVVRKLFGPGRSLSAELIAERRLEAKREEEEFG
jgi:AbrB family looped-hinge helix DNA binding protein